MRLKAVPCLFALLLAAQVLPGSSASAQLDSKQEEPGSQQESSGAGVLNDPAGISPPVQRVLLEMFMDGDNQARLLTGLMETDGQREETQTVLRALEMRLRELQVQQKQIQIEHGSLGVSEVSIDELQKYLQTQRVQLQVDLAGLEARKTALLEQLQAKQPAALQNESIREQLLMMEDVARKKLAMTHQLHEQGTASAAELMNCEAEVYSAELRRLEHERDHSGEQSIMQSEELMELSLEVAEKSSRLKTVTELLERLGPARDSIELRAMLQVEQEGLIHQRVARELDLMQIESKRERLKREIRLLEEMQEQREKKAGKNQPPSDQPSADQPSADQPSADQPSSDKQ